ncbi:unnamed protein product [Durusdinium trenchii]|uniref:Uncharacterized protein n=1 Tax=Durusdinium trenchii TaxID=1381693 RepID=A0ABP0KIU4_9DINO
MGIGRNRLHKVDCGNPDLRFGKREYRSKALTWSVDSFLQIAYDRIAETLPDKHAPNPAQPRYIMHEAVLNALAALQSPVLKKAEEKATVKREDGKSNEESPSAKRLCGIYEKKEMVRFMVLFKDETQLSPPADGLAVIEDWMTCFESMLFGGVDLSREPIDGNVTRTGSVAVVLPPLLCGSTGGGSLRADWRYCQSPLWMKQSLVNFPEAIEEKNFIVPGEMMTSNEARRNLSDVQETSQWLGGIHVPREVLVALQGTEKFVKPTLVVHPSAYDGALELAAMHMGFGSFSYSTQEVHFKCSKEIVKNSLVEAWKQGKSPMDKITPKYRRDPPQEEMPSSVDAPNLEICQLADGKLLLPTDVRQHFLQCPIWGNDWRKELQSFDAAWGTNAATTPTVAEPVAKKEEAAAGSADGRTQCFFPNEPASIDAVKAKYGDVIAEVPIPDAPIVLVVLPGSILFARATEATTLRAADGPILSHGPGSWLIGDKATKYDQQNAGKGLFCRWENDEGIVVLEEWDLGLMFFIAKGF